MKIGLVSPYDFSCPGGVVNHVAALASCLADMGQTVKVIAPMSGCVSEFEDNFIPIGRPWPVSVNGSIARITLSMNLAERIKSVLEEEHFDIIHFNEPFMPMLCTAMLCFSGAVNIGTFHASHWRGISGTASPLISILIKDLAKKLNGKIAVSSVAASYASHYLPGDYRIIPNGVDLKRFTPDGPELEQFNDGKKNILFVGRLEPRKGCMHLLRAFERVKKAYSDVRLIIVGQGDEMQNSYKNWAARRKLGQDIVFTGCVSNEELPRYYRSADIFCSPATGSESFGVVLLEAMASGKPVVASNIDGYAGVVTDGAEGILFPPGDEKALSGVLIRLLNEPVLCRAMGERGMATAGRYSWKDVAMRVFDFYLETMGKAGVKHHESKSKQMAATAV